MGFLVSHPDVVGKFYSADSFFHFLALHSSALHKL